MFVIDFTYLKPTVSMEALAAHRKFLDRLYAMESFLAAGPKPQQGGGDVVLINGAVLRSELETMLSNDPLLNHGAVQHSIVEFEPMTRHPVLNYVL